MNLRRSQLLALLSAALLCGSAPALWAQSANPCASGGSPHPLDDSGIGGTGRRPAPDDDSGIGGTGYRAAPDDDSGIGGTGISRGDTGLIGTITGFASICVGEVEIHYDADTPVAIDGQPSSTADLAVGQVVEVVATGGEALRASEIAVNHIVVGPITRIDTARHEIAVAGQPVELPPADREGNDAAGLSLGSVVRVSGMRRGDGLIIATRVAPGDAGEPTQLTGSLLALSPTTVVVAGTEVKLAVPSSIASGAEVRVVGRWLDDAVDATRIEALPRVPFDGRVAHVEIEGFARRSATGEIQIGAFPVDVAPADLRESLSSESRLRVEGRVQGRQVIVERCEVMRGPGDRPQRPEGGVGWDDHEHDDRKPGPGPALDGKGGGGPPAGGPPAAGGGPPHERGGPVRPERRGVDAPRPPERPGGDHPDMPPRVERPDKPDRPGPPDRPEQPERPERPEQPERPQLPERPDIGRPEAPRPERLERPERPRFDRPR